MLNLYRKIVIPLLLIVLLISCSRPLYIKNMHFNCTGNNYKIDSDLKELIYESLKRAVVIEKDIPDYRLIWEKQRVYVLNTYQTNKVSFTSQSNWEKNVKYLNSNEIPTKINNVNFCLKSKDELQKISNKTREDFLYISFSLIKIEKDTATIKIENNWSINKHSKKVYLSGGGYSCTYEKINGIWKFQRIMNRWIL